MTKASDKKPEKHTGRLSIFHVWLSVIYLLQGLFVLLVAATQLFPIEITYLTRDPLASEISGHTVLAQATKQLLEVNLAYLVSILFFIGALVHGIVWFLQRQSKRSLDKNIVSSGLIVASGGYALGAGVFFIILGLLAGITGIVPLILLFMGAILASVLWVTVAIQPKKMDSSLRSLLIAVGVIASVALWKVIAVQLWGAFVYGTDGLPGFVYVVAASAFILWVVAIALLFLRTRDTGRWGKPTHVVFYSVTGLVIVTVLAWQIILGVL